MHLPPASSLVAKALHISGQTGAQFCALPECGAAADGEYIYIEKKWFEKSSLTLANTLNTLVHSAFYYIKLLGKMFGLLGKHCLPVACIERISGGGVHNMG